MLLILDAIESVSCGIRFDEEDSVFDDSGSSVVRCQEFMNSVLSTVV